MILRTVLMLAALGLSAPTLAADAKASADCASKLPPEGKKMYDASAPAVKADSELRDVIRTGAIPLVMGGELTVEAAQAAGPAVGQCLALLK